MNGWFLYLLLGVVFLLFDFAKAAAQGTSIRDQLKASLYLSGDDLPHLSLAMLLYVVGWPIVLVMQGGGPPTRSA